MRQTTVGTRSRKDRLLLVRQNVWMGTVLLGAACALVVFHDHDIALSVRVIAGLHVLVILLGLDKSLGMIARLSRVNRVHLQKHMLVVSCLYLFTYYGSARYYYRGIHWEPAGFLLLVGCLPVVFLVAYLSLGIVDTKRQAGGNGDIHGE